jgi:hypothetical protein
MKLKGRHPRGEGRKNTAKITEEKFRNTDVDRQTYTKCKHF